MMMPNKEIQSSHPFILVVLHLPDSWSKCYLEMLFFEERGKSKYPEKNLLEQGREPTTIPTQIWLWGRKDLNLSHTGARRLLSALRHLDTLMVKQHLVYYISWLSSILIFSTFNWSYLQFKAMVWVAKIKNFCSILLLQESLLEG